MLGPIEQQQISQFAPIDVNTVLNTLEAKQQRQTAVLNEIDALKEFETLFPTTDADRDLFQEEFGDIRSGIEQLSEIGFVGDRMRQVRALGREAQRRALPFQQNFAAFEQSRQAVENNTTLTRAQKDARIEELRQTARLTRDDSGEIDSSSIFQGRQFASAVNLNELADKAVSGARAARTFDVREEGDLLGIRSDTYIPKRQIRQIATSAILNDPEAMAFINDEIDLLDAQQRRSTGQGLTSEQRDQIVNNMIQSSVEASVAKYGQRQSQIQLSSAGRRGSSSSGSAPKPGPVGFPMTVGNRPTRKPDAKAYLQQFDNMEAQIEDLQSRIDNPQTDEDRALMSVNRSRLSQLRTQLETQQAEVNQMLNERGIPLDVYERVSATKPERPAHNSDFESRLLDRYEREAEEQSTNLFQNTTIVPFVGESAHAKAYRQSLNDWSSRLSRTDKSYMSAINEGLEDIQAARGDVLLHGRTLPEDSSLRGDFEVLLKGSVRDTGAELLDSRFQPIDDDVDLDSLEISGYSLSPDDDGAYYVKMRDTENDLDVNLRMTPQQSQAFGRRLIEELGSNTSEDAMQIRATAMNMQGIGAANQLESMTAGTTITRIGNDPSLLQYNGEQWSVWKLPDGGFALKDANGELVVNSSTNEPFYWDNAQAFNAEFVIPRMMRNAGTE